LSKLNAKIDEGRLYEARLGYIKNKGMKITDAGIIDVNKIPTLMRNRKAEIIKDTKLFGNKNYNPKDINHKAIVRSILAQEFGLVD
jgi:predicted RNA-binding protein with PUA domain